MSGVRSAIGRSSSSTAAPAGSVMIMMAARPLVGAASAPSSGAGAAEARSSRRVTRLPTIMPTVAAIAIETHKTARRCQGGTRSESVVLPRDSAGGAV